MDITVHHADLIDQGGQRCWLLGLEVDRGDGPQMLAYLLPEDTLEWRAAELGIDPDDRTALLDIVLHEPFLPADAPDVEPPADQAEARARHLAKVRAVRGKGRVRGATGDSPYKPAARRADVLADSGTEDPLVVLRREMPVDPEFVAVKAEHVAAIRADVRRRFTARGTGPSAGRRDVDRLRAQLVRQRTGAPRSPA